ncbi:uncharacterized protein C1orf131 homolog [Acanthaster planci]|uniref:Uncharacterized protein C1orf131 homolog n=1 Tax=Acanthaster planci TaxID=133434 RepID=A0A8B7ZV91_ACAPL|nr:uncharacterized protein C1orf131 homolog [Acanthaster planci]
MSNIDGDNMDDILQRQLLNRLNEYGDNLLDEEDSDQKKSKIEKVKSKTKEQSVNWHNDHTNAAPNPSFSSSNKTRKKKKGKKKPSGTRSEGDEESARKKQGREVMDFEEELRQFKEEELQRQRLRKEAEQRQEGGKTKTPAPEVIVFEDPTRRKKKKVVDQDETNPSQGEFNLKRARLEVRQFGLTGFSFEDREKCEADRAIHLGAWAPKREYVNYKEYMAMQKKKKEEERHQREIDRKMGLKVSKKPTTEKTRVRNQGFWRDPSQDKKFFLDGQVGRYKQGVQVVGKDDIARVKTTSKKGNRPGSTRKIKL